MAQASDNADNAGSLCSVPGAKGAESADRPTVEPPNLISRLKAPTKSDCARKRKIERPQCSGRTKKHKAGAANLTDPKTVTPAQRVKQFPNECLAVRAGKLFCDACREEIAIKKSTIRSHLYSGEKHKASKERLAKKEARERDIAQNLIAYDKEVEPAGQALSMEVRVYRTKVVENFLRAGIPLSKVDSMREILEESSLRLTHSSHLSDYIPVLHKREQTEIREEIQGQDVAVIFDGTTRSGEALAVVVRFCKGWKVQQRLVKLQLLAKSLSGEEVAREVLTVLSTELGIQSNQLLAGIRDRASVNNVAVRMISVMYPLVLDIGCFSHTLNNVGEQFRIPVLDKFMKYWQEMFSRSHKARLVWREQTGRALKTYSPTRWWSRWECEKQLMELWGDVPKFITECGDLAPKCREKLSTLLGSKHEELMVELAITIDVGEALVNATYTLEGDGILALKCYDTINTVKAALEVQHWPNTEAVIHSFTAAPQSKWRAYASQCVKPAVDYFKLKFETELQPVVSAFKGARLFNPAKVNDLHPSSSDIDVLKSFKFLDTAICHLKGELPAYLAAADGVSLDIEPLEWWERHNAALPHWANAFRKIILCQPSSAAVERVFSILNSTFGSHQDSALQDYIETSVMLQYNKT